MFKPIILKMAMLTAAAQFPTTDLLLAHLDGDYSDLVYTSSQPDGSLSVCYYYKYAKKCSGWVAKVTTVKLTDMVVNSVVADYSTPATVYPGQKGVELGSLTVNTDGLKNPHSVTSISFRLENGGAINPEGITLWSGTTKIDATLSSEGDIYTLSMTHPLKNGANKLTLKTDILPSAPFHSKFSTEFTNLTTTAQSTPAITAGEHGTPVTTSVSATILMPSTPTTYTVDEQGYLFYDDGGKDGNISEGFSGEVTFVPGVTGKKVAIDFKSLQLFNTNPDRNDQLRIYNGTKAEADNLLRTLLTEGSALVRSTAPDGVLTVTFSSTTGIPKAGWSAEVNLFTPQPMSLKNITTKSLSSATTVAGEKECQMLTLDIITENTEPALTLKSLTVNTLGSNNVIDKAKVYYTRSNATYATTSLIGEADVTDDNVTINLTSPVTLAEGDNYFHIVYEINVTAQNDQEASCGLTSVNLSGNNVTIDDAAQTATRKINNVCYATSGSKVQNVYGSILFKNEPASQYSEGYAGGSDNRTVIFRPGNAGNVVEISEFSKFNFYSSYSGIASFKIYSGEGTGGTLLFEMKKENRNVIPTCPIRSTDPDGALTVVFNANGVGASTSSIYGWTATVSEYRLQPMTLTSDATVTQPNTGIIICSPTQTNQSLLGFNFTTAGSLDAMKITSIKVDMKGCAKNIAKVKLTTSRTDNTLSINNIIATGTPDGDSEIVTLTPTRDCDLVEGTNYFWINVDMKDDVRSDQIIDAKIVSIAVNGEDINIVNADPEGERVTKNIYLLESGKGHVVPVGDESLMFYDDGGPDEKITKYFSGTVTFVPRTEGKAIKMVVKQLGFANGEKLNLSYGKEVKTTLDVVIDYYSQAPMTVIALGDDGAITVDFSTNAYAQGDGWEIEVMEYELQPLSLGGVTAVAVNPAEALRGGNINLLRVDVTVDGDKGEFNVDGLSFSATNPSVITMATIYATGTDEAFSTTNPIATTDENLQFPLDYKITLPGVYHFYLTGVVGIDAALMSTTTVIPGSLTYNAEETATIDSDAPATVKVVSGFKGTYTIGGSDTADYATFSAAVEAMSIGVEGPVTFNVEDGTYNELVKIADIKGASETNAITFKSLSGNAENVILQSDNYTQPDYSDDRSYYEYGVLTVRGTDYVTFDGITIKTSVTSFPSIVRLADGAEHFTLKDCIVEAPISVNSYSGGNTDLLTTYVQSNHNEQVNNYLTLTGSTFRGGWIGVNMGGKWATVNPEEGSVIENCRFDNNGSKAIYINMGNNVSVKGNTLINTASTVSNYYMLDINATGASQFVGNKILQTAKVSSTSYAFYLRKLEASAETPAIIANNDVIISADAKTVYGIYNTAAVGDVNIAHNSFAVRGTNKNSSAIFFYKAMSGNVVNNLIQNEAGGYVFRFNQTSGVDNIAGMAFANNHTFSTGTSHSYSYPTGELDYAKWTEMSGETDGINAQATFDGATSLQPIERGQLVNGKPLEYVTTDITGAKRGQRPTIGAYEWQVVPGDYTDGVFIVNEDWFGRSNSTVNFYSTAGEWTYRAFQKENPGLSLGCTNQFGAIYGNKFYFISKQDQDAGDSDHTGARVTIADAVSLQAIEQHKTIDQDGAKADGRGFLGVDESKGYISTNSSIYVMNLDNNAITGKVTSDYTGETGTMVRVNDKVLAATLSGGILIIDPFTDKVTNVIDPAAVTGIEGAGAGSVVLAKDGNVYSSVTTNSNGGAAKKIIKIAPSTLECSVIDIPDEFHGPANSWYAWTPDGFCASTKENVLYWNGGQSSWTSAQLIYKYDIDINRVSRLIELESDVYLYGCSMRPHPVTDEIYMSVVKGNAWSNKTFLRRYKNDGTLINESQMEEYYWFPSLPVFPDNCDPVGNVAEPIVISGTEPSEIDLSDIAVDDDSMGAAMVKSLYDNDNPDVVEARVADGKLFVTPLENRTGNSATVHVNVNSNGKSVVVPIPLTFATVGVEAIGYDANTIVKYIDGTLYVAGAAGQSVEVYNMAGALVSTFTADSAKASMGLNLSKGVYITRIGNQSFKIVVK